MMANGGEPFACGSPILAHTFFILFNILVFQIFINLFVAVIIDAFLGQTLQFMLPVQKYQVQQYVKIWSKFDPKATGFISITDLDEFIRILACNQDSSGLVVLSQKVAQNHHFRRRFIGLLSIPTYD